MYVKTLVLVAFLVSTLGGVAFADDKDDILALIKEYSNLQMTGDIMGQMKMMTSDRVFINGGRRLSDQAANMKSQQAGADRTKKRDPGRQTIVTSTDHIIRVYGDAAMASFFWHFNTIYSVEYLEKVAPNTPPAWNSLIVTQVLVKEGGTWKIDYTHISPLGAN